MIKKLLFILITVVFFSCQKDYTPKPRGFFRISFPEHEYQRFEADCPFTFDYPTYANIKIDNPDSCWYNVVFPEFHGKIHLTYRSLSGNAFESMEDSRTLVYKHAVMADKIGETMYTNPDKNVHGIFYDIKGNTASSLQFFVTDSTAHFIRGALYFDSSPNKDSLAPVVDFIKTDMLRMVESFEWK